MKKTLIIIALLSTIIAKSQDIVESKIEEAIPQEVLEIIKNNTNFTTVFPIGNNENFNGQIINANEIVFSDGAHLILENTDVPWILIKANKIKVQNPNKISKITFKRATLKTPDKAAKGGNGANGTTYRDWRNGQHGGHGRTGITGKTGLTKNLPHVYIVTKEFSSPIGMPAFAPIAILGNGYKGGIGGAGGDGGNGGKGYKGRRGSSGTFDCRRGGGNGGNGGNAGLGGKGGTGGTGGNGVSVTIISSQQVNESFSYMQLLNEGGKGGNGGIPGTHGAAGKGGSLGSGTGHCSGGRTGKSGVTPNPSNLGNGIQGKSGKKGKFILVNATDLDTIYN